MEKIFDISEEELPIFLAEADEHLQVLDDGLVRLEREAGNPELLQALFRAAHTLKGSAGMIGHKRMVELTHALETAFDALRKHNIGVSVRMIDMCLEAVDSLRLLCDEVVQDRISVIEYKHLVDGFLRLASGQSSEAEEPQKPANGKKSARPAAKAQAASASFEPTPQPAPEPAPTQDEKYTIHARIAENSIASAARAFQIIMALQELGTVLSTEPSQAQIETAAPVHAFRAEFVPNRSMDAETRVEIMKALGAISEVEEIGFDGAEAAPQISAAQISTAQMPVPAAPAQPAEPGEPAEADEAVEADLEVEETEVYPREVHKPALGEVLVNLGAISQEQLKQALEKQQGGGPALTLGQALLQMGAITEERLNEAIAEQKKKQQAQAEASAALAASTAVPSTAVEPAAADRRPARVAEKTVRTSVERLDTLMNLVGELITDRNRIYQIRRDFENRFRGDEQVDTLSETVTHIGRITDQLQAEVMSIRMLPIANVFSKFPRLVRDLARKKNREIDLVTRGEETELDRSVIEEISDPLIHLLRNAVDHGIESPEERRAAGKPERGVVLLTARHEQGRIIITVEDNGKGIDTERVKMKAIERGLISKAEAEAMAPEEAIDLIFASGLSTAEKVSDISGRGVGMDIVRNNIERLNGSILVESWPGRGTQFQIVLPLTLAIVPTLLVRVGKGTYAIPLVTVTETLRVALDSIQTINSRPVIVLRDHVLPVIRLTSIFKIQPTEAKRQYEYIVVVRAGKSQMGVIVDSLLGEQEVVVKSLGAVIGEVMGVSSAAILGDGQVALILDVQGLFKSAAHN